MVVTDLEHAVEQLALNRGLRAGLAFLQQANLLTLADGRVEIDGRQAYALVQSYETECGAPKFEVHRKYLDLHYMVSGEELIGWALINQMVVDFPYDVAKDVCLGHVPESAVAPVRLAPGQLAVFYPSDAHAPKLTAGTPGPVKKIVVKVAIPHAGINCAFSKR